MKKILVAQGWMLKAIFNNPSNADHIGGNQHLQGQTGCKIYVRGMGKAEIIFENNRMLWKGVE